MTACTPLCDDGYVLVSNSNSIREKLYTRSSEQRKRVRLASAHMYHSTECYSSMCVNMLFLYGPKMPWVCVRCGVLCVCMRGTSWMPYPRPVLSLYQWIHDAHVCHECFIFETTNRRIENLHVHSYSFFPILFRFRRIFYSDSFDTELVETQQAHSFIPKARVDVIATYLISFRERLRHMGRFGWRDRRYASACVLCGCVRVCVCEVSVTSGWRIARWWITNTIVSPQLRLIYRNSCTNTMANKQRDTGNDCCVQKFE